MNAHPRLVFLSVLIAGAAPAAAQCVTLRASTDAAGVEGDQGSGLGSSHQNRNYLSADGRFVAFWSAATNLVPGDANGKVDVFVRDLVTNAVERVSVDSAGLEGDGDSLEPAISADGNLVAFQSAATNLVAGDTNGRIDVFVRNRSAGTTIRVSVDSAGVEGNGNSTRPDISADGLWVAFQSLATNLHPADTNNRIDVWEHALTTSTTRCVSQTAAGVIGNEASGAPALSADGRFVAFHTLSSNLLAGDLNAQYDVYVYDRVTQAFELVSVSSAGVQGNFFSQTPSISANGRFVAFSSAAATLVAGDTNNVFDVFRRDRALGRTIRLSVDNGGFQGNSTSQGSSISADGRFVVFQSSANNLVPGDTNGGPLQLDFDVFVHDCDLATTARVSIDSAGAQAASGSSLHGCVSADASRVAFCSDATDLAAGDTNLARDLFARGCGAPPGPWPYCAGDGTGTACPCGNNGATGRGCENSFGTGGGRLEGSGRTSVADDQLYLSAYALPPTASALFFQGDGELAGANGVVFGDGLRCAGGQVWRLGARFASGGAAQFGYGVPGDPAISVLGHVPAGTVSVRVYQIWYRNVAEFCTPAAFNLTNALRVVWTP